MLRIHCTDKDLLRSRFLPRPAPLPELVNALMILRGRDHGVFDQWRQTIWAEFPVEALPLLQLVFPESGSEYLDSLEPTLEGGIDDVLSSPAGLVRVPWDLRGIDRPMTTWVRQLADGDREAQAILKRALISAHETLIAREWSTVEASYQDDLAYRQPFLLGEGIGAALASVFPSARWNGMVLEVGGRPHRDIQLNGNGILLMPSAFWAGRPLVSECLPGRPLLIIYPARIPFPLVDRLAESPRSLAPLMGRTRAAVLRTIVANPATTTTALAQRLGISPGRASEHAKVLREAGLITTHRHRNTVLHTPTALGTQLNTR